MAASEAAHVSITVALTNKARLSAEFFLILSPTSAVRSPGFHLELIVDHSELPDPNDLRGAPGVPHSHPWPLLIACAVL